jgi:hypothetical protein
MKIIRVFKESLNKCLLILLCVDKLTLVFRLNQTVLMFHLKWQINYLPGSSAFYLDVDEADYYLYVIYLSRYM